jgi:pimeloyl-ACP methyl ester carboxylesterase
MAQFVLVHGGGHGGWCFQPVARLLRENGHDVYAPTLTGLGERAHLFRAGVDLDCHIQDIVDLLHHEDLQNVIMVGHSYGGVVITGAADRVFNRVGHLVYLDSMPPKDGQSVADIAGPMVKALSSDRRIVDGVEMCLFPSDQTLRFYGVADVNPQTLDWMRAHLTPHPWRCFEQPIQLTNDSALQSIPQSYIGTTRFLSLRNVDRLRARCGGRVWDIDTGHDLMITEPGKVAELLDGVAQLVSDG